ncbi:MAG TPA: hypothetical protein VMT70_20095, partial [Vicinamibacteria bacterium]|nr:hypothetical protein [Vicinamibacteria bacterium]
MDLQSRVPEAVHRKWPEAEATIRKYGHVIYAATPVRELGDASAVCDLLDLSSGSSTPGSVQI